MRSLSIAAILALIFGSATLVFVLNQDYAERRADERRAQIADRIAERADQAEAERRATELAAQRAAQATVNPVAPGIAPSFNPFNPLNPLAAAGAQGGAAAPAYDGPVRDDLGGLPDTPGVEIVFYGCTACHSLDIVTQQHLTRARWDYLLTWMVEEQGMGDLEDDRAVALDYLDRHFGAD